MNWIDEALRDKLVFDVKMSSRTWLTYEDKWQIWIRTL